MNESEKFLCVIGHHAADAVFVHDMAGRIIDVNDQACESLGYSRQELLAMHVKDIDTEFFDKDHHRRYWEKLEPKKHVILESFHRRKDGTEFPIEVSLALLDVGDRQNIIAVARNTSERKKAEEEFRRIREKLDGVIASTTDHMSMIDRAHNIVWTNDVAKSLFGPALVGKKCYDVYHGFDHACRPCVVQACFQDGRVHEHETEVISAGGSRRVFWCTASVASRDRDGMPQLVVEVSRDITDRKITEEKLLSYKIRARQLASQLSLAEEKERRRIAHAVHDHIGQNLAFVKIKLTELQKSGPCPHCSDAIEEVLALIDSTIRDARSLVSNIGSPVLYELGFEPAVQWLLKEMGHKNPINVFFNNDNDPKPLSDDVKVFLFQAVRELLINVVKHSKASQCTVNLKTDGERIRVDIDDNGIGFDIENIHSLETDGKHFGFFSIRERLEPIGGSIGIVSRPNRGTRITLFAPLDM